MDPVEPFDKDIFDTVLASSNVIREEVDRQTGENIKKAQKKQQRDYENRNKSLASNDGPYVVSDINKKGLVTLKNENDKELEKSIKGTIETSFSRSEWNQ